MNKTSLAIAFCGAALGAVYFYYQTIPPRKDLDRFLTLTAEVEIGKTKLADFSAIMKQEELSQLAFPCRNTTCGYSLRVQNSMLSKLRLAPHTIALAEIDFDKGIASEIYIVMEVEWRDQSGLEFPEKSVVIRQTSEIGTSCPSSYKIGYQRKTSSETIRAATLTMDACVSKEDKLRALGINTNCLSRIGGCKDVKLIQPRVF